MWWKLQKLRLTGVALRWLITFKEWDWAGKLMKSRKSLINSIVLKMEKLDNEFKDK